MLLQILQLQLQLHILRRLYKINTEIERAHTYIILKVSYLCIKLNNACMRKCMYVSKHGLGLFECLFANTAGEYTYVRQYGKYLYVYRQQLQLQRQQQRQQQQQQIVKAHIEKMHVASMKTTTTVYVICITGYIYTCIHTYVNVCCCFGIHLH